MTDSRPTDTVRRAEQSPDTEQPWQALGLKADEYAQVREILSRRPTSSELAMYSVMWSEHCSYKSSKVHLRQFGEGLSDTMRAPLMVGIGENAGVVDIGDGYAVTFKVESHNHPSYVEPYQGAATGVGGIVRDILAMGARPVAVMDSLRFGPLDAPDTSRVLPGVVAGVGGYGNCIGLPNIGGETVFDASYAGNPLVNALCVGVMRHEQIHLAKASGVGNRIILYGAQTGGDGIGGVSVLASEAFDSAGQTKRPSVQVGDPFTEKLLIECTLELFAAELVAGIQDLGGAGLSCATSELASAGDGGMQVRLDQVPLRDPTLAAEEILMSESQERMMAVVEPRHVDEFMAICAKWDVEATVIGEVTDTGRLVIDWHGETIVDVPPATVAHEGPVYQQAPQPTRPGRTGCRPSLSRPRGWSDRTVATSFARPCWRSPVPPTCATESWITDQYDRYVQGNTVLAQPEDAGVIRVDERSGLGVAVAMDCNARFARLDPYAGAQLALAEAYRNVSSTGARPIAVTDCLNFGSPEDPGVMWQFAEAARGLADGCRTLEVPVTGGNVSLYNQTGDVAILPTPVVGVLGVLDDVTRRTPIGFTAPGQRVYLLGRTSPDLDGSAWAAVRHGHLGGRPPSLDLDAERALSEVLVTAGRRQLLAAAHDVSEGGLAQALVESCLRRGFGARVAPPDGSALEVFEWLFSESPSRALVAAEPSDAAAFESLCADRGVPVQPIGSTEGVGDGAVLEVEGSFGVPLGELRAAWSSTLPARFDDLADTHASLAS